MMIVWLKIFLFAAAAAFHKTKDDYIGAVFKNNVSCLSNTKYTQWNDE